VSEEEEREEQLRQWQLGRGVGMNSMTGKHDDRFEREFQVSEDAWRMAWRLSRQHFIDNELRPLLEMARSACNCNGVSFIHSIDEIFNKAKEEL
jgi:hypothetical protein